MPRISALLIPVLLTAGLLTSGVLLARQAAAENFRCGRWIASPDMSVEELLEKCGEPTHKIVETEDVYARSAAGGWFKTGVTTVETWTYDRGSQSFPMVVVIVDGKIKSMERGR